MHYEIETHEAEDVFQILVCNINCILNILNDTHTVLRTVFYRNEIVFYKRHFYCIIMLKSCTVRKMNQGKQSHYGMNRMY